jgi:hypothetical protein
MVGGETVTDIIKLEMSKQFAKEVRRYMHLGEAEMTRIVRSQFKSRPLKDLIRDANKKFLIQRDADND